MSMQRRSRLPPLAYIYICEHIYIYIYIDFFCLLMCSHAVTASTVTVRSRRPQSRRGHCAVTGCSHARSRCEVMVCAVTVQCGRGGIRAARRSKSRCGHDAVTVRSRCGHGAVTERSRCGHGAVRSRGDVRSPCPVTAPAEQGRGAEQRLVIAVK